MPILTVVSDTAFDLGVTPTTDGRPGLRGGFESGGGLEGFRRLRGRSSARGRPMPRGGVCRGRGALVRLTDREAR